jgi:replicative DNA helicase
MNNIELQRAYAGLILNDNNILYETVISDHHLTDALTKEIIKVSRQIIDEGKEANIISVCDRSKALEKRAADVSQCTTGLLVNIKYIEDEIIKRFQTKQIKELGEELIRLSGDPEKSMELIDEKLPTIANMSEEDRIYESGALLKSLFDIIEKRYHNDGELPGLPTGFPSLDKYTAGFQTGLLYVIGARPSQGKSAMLLNMASFLSSRGEPVGIISVESSKTEILMRDLANMSTIDSHRIKTGFLKESDFAGLQMAASKMFKRPLYIYDQPNAGITKLQSVAKVMLRKYKIKALFIDYLQIIGASRKSDARKDQVQEVSMALKNLTRTLNIPVIVAAQLTRDSENRRPTLRDFADSSQIEKDADVAMLIHHDTNKDGELRSIWLNVEKNRDGAKTSIPLGFDGRYIRFFEPERQTP